jgi:tRNA pseudouridine13 synthase
MTLSASELGRLKTSADPGSLAYAYGGPCGKVSIRCVPEDFHVAEFTGLSPAGEGEHLLLRIRKTGQNTRWVAKRLAEYLNVAYKSVSYAGMKDRHAVTEQWFSVHLPGQPDPDLDTNPIEGCEFLEHARHNRKLRPGQLSYNRFHIVLRECAVADAPSLEKRIAEIAAQGVPNYFGPQRFGRNLGNLSLADSVAAVRRLDRDKRAFLLSALRGALFNAYLAGRVADASWDKFLEGEVQLSDRPRGVAENDSTVLTAERQPSGLLWGKGVSTATGLARQSEEQFFAAFPDVTALLDGAGSRASRRVLRLKVAELALRQHDDRIEMNFVLGPGAYATTVLRELFDVIDRSQDISARTEAAC